MGTAGLLFLRRRLDFSQILWYNFLRQTFFENPKGKRQKHMEGEKNGHYAWDFRYYDWRWNIVADEKICPVKKGIRHREWRDSLSFTALFFSAGVLF